MRCLSILLAGVLVSTAFELANAQGGKAAEKAPEKSIATVLCKLIYLKDLEIDENDKTALRDYFAIAGPVTSPLVAKYITDHRLTATPKEIKEVRFWFSAIPRPNPGDLDLTAEERKQLDDTTKIFDDTNKKSKEPGTEESKALDEVAKAWVEGWKFNKALYQKYGGRVVFQQAGLEPLDGLRSWLKDEEKAGNFRLHDPKWRQAFWEYYKPEYHRFVDEPDAFKEPPWNLPIKAKSDPARRDEG